MIDYISMIESKITGQRENGPCGILSIEVGFDKKFMVIVEVGINSLFPIESTHRPRLLIISWFSLSGTLLKVAFLVSAC